MSNGVVLKDPPRINFKTAKKELGMGLPPDQFGCADDMALVRALCSPSAKLVVVEVARWTIDLPVADANIATTFGDSIDVWSTPNAKPPNGVAFASNTLDVPGQVPSDMILRGLSVRILVEPEMRTIDGNGYTPPAGPGPIVFPGSPDVWTTLDQTNGALGTAAGSTMIPASLLYGLPTWKAAYALMNGYELVWSKNHQDQLMREPLTQSATIEPFSEAEAAGLAFVNNAIAINESNGAYLAQFAAAGAGLSRFLPITHQRVGVFGAPALPIGDFAPTRERDASPTIVGSIGVPQGKTQMDPYLFATPIFWPAGKTMGIKFGVHDPKWQQQFQRWLSISGGSGGTPGTDLNIPVDPTVGGMSGVSPTTAGAMLELSEDAAPMGVQGQVQTNRQIRKAGRLVFEIGLVGQRVPESWMMLVAAAVRSGAIQAPNGYGSLAAYLSQLK